MDAFLHIQVRITMELPCRFFILPQFWNLLLSISLFLLFVLDNSSPHPRREKGALSIIGTKKNKQNKKLTDVCIYQCSVSYFSFQFFFNRTSKIRIFIRAHFSVFRFLFAIILSRWEYSHSFFLIKTLHVGITVYPCSFDYFKVTHQKVRWRSSVCVLLFLCNREGHLIIAFSAALSSRSKNSYIHNFIHIYMSQHFFFFYLSDL